MEQNKQYEIEEETKEFLKYFPNGGFVNNFISCDIERNDNKPYQQLRKNGKDYIYSAKTNRLFKIDFLKKDLKT